MRLLLTLLGISLLWSLPFLTPKLAQCEPLYTQVGTDPTFAEIMSKGMLKQGEKSTVGVTGSIIRINKRLVDVGPDAHHPIARDILLHTLGNSAIKRKDFSKWSRWYQEDGNVQIFRLFQGECNERNRRPLAARVETYSGLHWQNGTWHEWSGTYTIIKPGGACIFQLFNNKSIWIVHLNMNFKGDVILDHRPNHIIGPRSEILATNMIGKPFFVRVRDNGLDYEVYLDQKRVDSGAFPRPQGSKNTFRWGMYVGEHPINHEMMIFVTGAAFH